MSSSKIIKSAQLGQGNVGSFAFQPIGQATGGQVGDDTAGEFVPMGIFDPSEVIKDTVTDRQPEEPQEADDPPAVTVTEEEMESRLAASFERGLTEGKNLAERGLVNVFRSLRAATEGVQSLRERVLRESEDDLIDLVMKVARKVILREVAMDRGILVNVVRTAIDALSERSEITIRLNPDDYILITTGPGESIRKELFTERMQLKSDPAVLQGSCQIDSEMGTLDAGIDGQMDEIFRRLLEERALSVNDDTQ